MPNVTILGHLGLLLGRGFRSAEYCRQIRREMPVAARVPAMAQPAGEAGGVLDQTTRQTGVESVSISTTTMVEEKLRAQPACLGEPLLVQLAGWRRPQFYTYEESDFFVPRRDRDWDNPEQLTGSRHARFLIRSS